jgi:hypothetical protein
VGVTQVTASERDQRWASARARYLDARHVVLAATSLVAVLAIALSLTGRRAADAFADRLGVGPVLLDRPQPVNLNTIANASDLAALLAPVVPDPTQRQAAATELYQFILTRHERGESLPNVGALLDAKHGTTERSVLTRGDLAAIKPFAIVRTSEAHEQLVVRWGAIYLASIWLVVCSGGRSACAATISCWPPLISSPRWASRRSSVARIRCATRRCSSGTHS